jgi:leucyl aminopeptidase (aminopeptidase T)
VTEFDSLFALVDLRPSDSVVVVSDTRSDEQVARLLFEEILARGADGSWSHVRARERNGDELPTAVRSSLMATDLVMLLTSWSPTHSSGLIEAMSHGARVTSMPGLTGKLLGRGGMTADYEEVKRLTDRWGRCLAAGQRISLRTAAGTDLQAELGGWERLPLLDGGPLPRGLGGFANFPAGEAAIAPIEGTTRGQVVIDLTASTTRAPLASPIALTVNHGVVDDIEGGAEAEALSAFLDAAGESSRIVAEIALGTNAKALHTGLILEDEKRLGSAHIGLGNSLGLGGTNESPVHIDLVFDAATVTVDDLELLVDGVPTRAAFEPESLQEMRGNSGRFILANPHTETRDGRLFVRWHEVRGFPVWAQVGDDPAAVAAANLLRDGPLHADADSDRARVLALLERYRVVRPVGDAERASPR